MRCTYTNGGAAVASIYLDATDKSSLSFNYTRVNPGSVARIEVIGRNESIDSGNYTVLSTIKTAGLNKIDTKGYKYISIQILENATTSNVSYYSYVDLNSIKFE